MSKKLEKLIKEYEAAIHAQVPSSKKIEDLARQVEVEADRVDYSNHSRLRALHTAAERALEIAR
jgi:predicted site-specific integrase-resolvase